MKKVAIYTHDPVLLWMKDEHYGYYYEISEELYNEYSEIRKKFEDFQAKIKYIIDTQKEIDEDEL